MQFSGDTDYPMLSARVIGTVRIKAQHFYLIVCSIREGDFQILSNGVNWYGLEEDRISGMSERDKDIIANSIRAYLE